ncbi:MAG: polysaccharide deacetylase family protein [Kiritimatiellaeota bacterium]|nr:polysaccharide deacetylase family protein [Kiritimatiellota bacterium]
MVLFFYVLAVGAVTAILCHYTVWRRPCPSAWPRVLMYHACREAAPQGMKAALCVTPSRFEAQVRLLKKRGYAFVTLSELVGRRDHTKTVAITFDDGYAEVAETVLPILERYGAKATVFLAQSGCPCADLLLSPDQIRHLAASPLIEIGAHTLCHANLADVPPDEAEREIAEGKAWVESLTGKPCAVFAYPYGRFTDATVELLERHGFIAAVTVKKGFAPLTECFRIRRTNVLRSCNMIQFRILLRCGRYKV